jgi:hypothetical protein
MGRVTFNGNIATAESQAYIRRARQAIYAQTGKDEFALAREEELLYRENGLVPGTFLRAGSTDVIEGGYSGDREDYDMPRYRNRSGLGGLLRDFLGWCAGFALIIVALALMKAWNLM